MSWIPQQFYEDHLLSGENYSDISFDVVGEEVQRLSVVNSLPSLLSGSDCSLCMQRIVPKLLLSLDKSSKEFHVASALTFYTILEKKLIHPRTYSQTFLRSMIDHIDFKVPEVASVWLDVLLDAIALLPVDIIRSEIVPVAISKSQISQNVASRVKACKLLGKASLRLDKFFLKKEILPVILSLCQDVNQEVRACICSELSNVSKSLDIETSKSTLLPTLVELASDEEANVRIAAVSTIVDVLPHLAADSIKSTIVPLVKKLCNQSMTAQDDALVSVSFQIGKLSLGLEHHMTIAEKQWLLSFYRDMAHLGAKKSHDRRTFPIPDFTMMGSADRVILCRQNCAFNFPALAIFCTKLGDSAHEQLYSTFCNLITDPYFMVRRTIACGFHEVTSVLGPSCGMVKTELAKLLRDDVEEVLHGLIPNLSKSMEQLAKYGALGPDNMDAQSLEIGRAILKCESEINETHNWRLHSMLLGQLECLPLCLPSEFLHNYFIPIIFNRIHKSRAVPCRVAAARTLLVFLRYNPKAPQRNDLRIRIINEFCRGRSCFARMAFAKLCGAAMDIFSRRYFKEHFFMQLLELSDDKVANVRMQFVNHLPRLKSMLRLPADKKLLLNLEACVRKLASTESDRDVKAMLNVAMKELERITVREEGAGAMPLSREDVEDQRKLEEENKYAAAKSESATRKRNVDVSKTTTTPIRSGAGYGRRGARADRDATRASAAVAGRTRVGVVQSSPVLRSQSLASLEDEFYVDAGIRIPHQLAVSGDLASFPTRIPNLREILFKNRNVNGYNDSMNTSCFAPIASSAESTVMTSSNTLEESLDKHLTSPVSSSAPLASNKTTAAEPKVQLKPNYSTSVGHDNTMKNVGLKSGSSPQSCIAVKQNEDSFSENDGNSTSCVKLKHKTGTLEQKQRIPTAVNRRHSYMEGDRTIKTPAVVNKTGCVQVRETGFSSGNRRHSYIDKVSSDEENKSSYLVKCNFVRTTNVSRNTYMEMEHSNSSLKVKKDVIRRKSSIPNRHFNIENKISDIPVKRRSLIYMPHHSSSRVNSTERRNEFEDNPTSMESKCSQILKHPQSFSIENKRSRSSLERDDLEKLRNPSYKLSSQNSGIQIRNLRSSLESINIVKQSDFDKSQKQCCINKSSVDKTSSQQSKKMDILGSSATDDNLELMLRKRNKLSLSKIPRGPASCHSSPGGSRATSPTGLVSNGIIRIRSEKDGSNKEIIITSGLSLPEDLAVDWITGNIYFTDAQMKHIGVCENSGKTCTVLVNKDIDAPRAIALLVTEGLMFWTDWGRKPMVARAGMDGSSPVAFVSENIKWPGGLALDAHNERVYWVDTKLDLIESIKFDGSDRRTILGEVVKHAFALDVFEENLYWSDMKTSEIRSCNKFTGKNVKKIEYSRDNYVYGLHIYHPSIYSKNTTNPCKDAPCSDMCLLAPNLTYSCACPENKILKEDEHTCIAIEKHEVLAVGGGSQIVLLTHKAFGKQEMLSIPFQHVQKIGALAYHNIEDSIFISDVVRKQISIVDLETQFLKPLISHEIGTVLSLAYDYLGNNLYWCDSEHGTVEVLSLSTLTRATLFRSYGEDTPMAVVVLPEKGIMFVVFKRSHGLNHCHIDKMNMDGTGGITHFIETNLQGPTVTLTHDEQLDELIFADSGRASIESCETDGTHHEPLQSLSHSPISVATLGNDLFWTSKESIHLYWSSKMKKFSQVKRIPLGRFDEEDSLVLTSVKGKSLDPGHPCRTHNGGCSHLCLVSSHGSVCACPNDYALQSDNKTCTIPTHCAKHQFKCERENKCIPLSFRCNGHQDCLTNEDEMNCQEPCHPDEFECNNGQCISSIQRCDDQTQCSDGSDEFNCRPEVCAPGKFQCYSGECIPEEWKCDLHEDCKDRSDEENEDCLQEVPCPEGKFRCKSGTCIPATWECDHEINCADASDEHEGCPQPFCAPEDFSCANKRCIDQSLKCNNIDECGDNSDEENCPQTGPKPRLPGCTENQFRCKNEENLCLPISVRCNGSAECPKGEDELGCGCSQSEFECDHNKCIDESWVCDGKADCIDKSDEEPLLCRPAPGPCLGYRCTSGQCIELSNACDGTPDCSDKSDEGPKCTPGCDHGNPCEGICNPTPSGPQCSCPPGFLMRESSSCVDEDECSQNVCAQLCENTLGSFRCSCVPGYTLNRNRRSCKADGEALKVLFTVNGNEIRIAPISFEKVSILHKDFGATIQSLDINIQRKLVYWSTGRRGAIFLKSLEDKTLKNVTGLGRPMKIAVDWITDNIYFSDESEDSTWIKVCNFEVRRCAKILAAANGYQIDNLVVDPVAGYIFWTEGNEVSSYIIKRADMTGSNSFSLVTGVSFVTGLATDIIHRRLFWVDRKEASAGAVGYHGEGRHLVLDREVKHASGLELHEDNLYWVSHELGRLVKCTVFGQPKTCDWIQLYARNVNLFALLQEQRQIKGENKCLQKSCTHMCVSGAKEPHCICSDSTLVDDHEECGNETPMILNVSDDAIQQTRFPVVAVLLIILCLLIALIALVYVFRAKLKISTPDFSRSVRFITSPYATLKKATTGSTKLDSKMDVEEEMEDVLQKDKPKSPTVPVAPATTPVSSNGRRTLKFRISDFQSSDEETDFSGKDTARLIP